MVEPLDVSPPARVLLIEPDPRAALWIGEMLRATWTDSLIVAHAERLADATQELLDHAATCVLLDDSRIYGDGLASLSAARGGLRRTIDSGSA